MFIDALISWFRPQEIAQCGHNTKRYGKIRAFGAALALKLTPKPGDRPEFCLSCLEKMSIRCAWCNEVIFVGDPITLYASADKSHVFPPHAVHYDASPGSVVGCMRWECAESGADRMGFWMPGKDGRGRVDRRPSLLELVLATGKAVVINDISDPSEEPKIAERS